MKEMVIFWIITIIGAFLWGAEAGSNGRYK
jgi:hypothetical protein